MTDVSQDHLPNHLRRLGVRLHRAFILFDLSSTTIEQMMDWQNPQYVARVVQDLPRRWRRCIPLIVISFSYVLVRVNAYLSHGYGCRSLIYMATAVAATRTDPLLDLVVNLGLVTTLNAALTALTFATVFTMARRRDGTEPGRSTRAFIEVRHAFYTRLQSLTNTTPLKTAASRARDGTQFTELSVLVAAPTAAAQWWVLRPLNLLPESPSRTLRASTY